MINILFINNKELQRSREAGIEKKAKWGYNPTDIYQMGVVLPHEN
jgi:hypothetical protein